MSLSVQVLVPQTYLTKSGVLLPKVSVACYTYSSTMDSLDNVTLDNVTMFNRPSHNPESESHCYGLYEYSSTIYIPFFHALVMVTGLVVNLYMVITLYWSCSKYSGRQRKVLSDVDVFFSHLGVCDIATLLTIPVWVTQTILVRGWVFGFVMCKLLKGVISVGNSNLST